MDDVEQRKVIMRWDCPVCAAHFALCMYHIPHDGVVYCPVCRVSLTTKDDVDAILVEKFNLPPRDPPKPQPQPLVPAVPVKKQKRALPAYLKVVK